MSKSRQCAAGKSSVFERFRDFTFSHQTAADTHRKVEGYWKRAIRATVDRLLASCWKSEDRRGCSGHGLASNISHIQYTYEVAVVLASRHGPCRAGFQTQSPKDSLVRLNAGTGGYSSMAWTLRHYYLATKEQATSCVCHDSLQFSMLSRARHNPYA